MNFNNERGLTINRDRLYVPVCDRFLPSHPKERYGKLPYWYFRTRFRMYGTAFYDLPYRSLRRYPEYTERMWYKISRAIIQEKFFPLGALLPLHSLFFEVHSLQVEGDKRDLSETWGFVYE